VVLIKQEQCGVCKDTWIDGCGLSKSEYNETKSKMLQSIKKNGGFYIGKYETGYFLEEGNTNYRSDDNHLSTEFKAVIKQNAFPYNLVTCSQAESLAKEFATNGNTSSLLFGIQWDLTLKYLKEKGVMSVSDLTSNSTNWGNYSNSTFSLTDKNSWHFISNAWKKGLYNKTQDNNVLLTTGAIKDFSRKNIYDLAGNVTEWTLETIEGAFISRGGACVYDGETFPVSTHLFRKFDRLCITIWI